MVNKLNLSRLLQAVLGQYLIKCFPRMSVLISQTLALCDIVGFLVEELQNHLITLKTLHLRVVLFGHLILKRG